MFHRYFDFLMIFVIALNSLTLSLYDYSDRDSNTYYNQVIDVTNVCFTVIFILEACMKIISFGLILHSDAYLRSGWNIIDAAVVISG
jgi:Ion transport protein